MELSIADRIYLQNALPTESDITTLRIIGDLNRELSFTEEELARGGIVPRDGGVQWDPAREFTKDITIGPRAFRVIADALESRNRHKKLTLGEVPLYERFCGDGGPDVDSLADELANTTKGGQLGTAMEA